MPSHAAHPTAQRRRQPMDRGAGTATVSYDSRRGALWATAIALAFFWLSNPLVLWVWDASLRNALAVTLVALLVTPGRRMPRWPPWSVVALLAYGMLSSLWSPFSRLSGDFTLMYVAVALVALTVVTTVDARTVAHGMMLGGVLVFAVSLYVYARDIPGSAASPGEGYIAGVGSNRNILSYTLVLALPFALSFLPRTWRGRSSWALGLAALIVGLYLTQSATGLVSAVVLVGAAAVMGWRDRLATRPAGLSRGANWGLLLTPMAILAVAVVVLQVLLNTSTRDSSTFTGRTPLWSAVWDTTDGWHRWFGSGWGVVWPHPWYPAPPNDAFTAIVDHSQLILAHGHNSFFDLLPEIGIVGSLLYVGICLQALWTGARMRRLGSEPSVARLQVSRATVLGVLAVVICGITEPLSTIPLGWFVLVTVVAGMAPTLDQRKAVARIARTSSSSKSSASCS